MDDYKQVIDQYEIEIVDLNKQLKAYKKKSED